MLTETFVAVFLLVCLACFFSVNLHNILRVHKRTSQEKVYAEVERSSGFVVGVAAAGTMVYFFEVLLYLFLVFSGLISVLSDFPIRFQFVFAFPLQLTGLVFTVVGYIVFIWSVIARGRYAVSWEMPESHKLVTWGPYRYVRHPSYLGYFFMFFGLFFVWPNFFTLLPMAAIPGYYRITFEEEKLLTRRFGDEYVEYQKKTGRFIPKFQRV